MPLFSKFDSMVNQAKITPDAGKSSGLVFGDASLKPKHVGQGVTGGSGGDKPYWQTTSRQDFAKHWPKLFAKQEYHLNQLKVHKVPVHLSGPRDKTLLPIFYVATVGLVLYNLFEFRKLILKK